MPIPAVIIPAAGSDIATGCARVLGQEVGMTPSFRSSGTIVHIVQQVDGRHEIVAVQVNIVPVGPADEGNMDMVASAAVSTFNKYETP